MRLAFNLTRILFVISEDWALMSHRFHLVEAAVRAGYEVAVATNFSIHRSKIKNTGAKTYHWPLNRGTFSLIQAFKSIVSLKSIIHEFQPDLVHAVAQKPVLYSGLISKMTKNIKFVGALGGLGFIFRSKKLNARLLAFFLKPLLKFIFNSSRAMLILQNPEDKLFFEVNSISNQKNLKLIKGSGVEINKFTPSPLPKSAPIIMMPARLLWDKGIEEFSELSKRFKMKNQEAKFVLVGDFDPHNPEAVPKEYIYDLVKDGFIEYWEKQEKMEKIYPKALVVCLLSYHEGLPKVLLEAASAARPVVAFDIPGCREIVRNNINGKLVPFGDIAKLEECIFELIQNPNLCSRLGLEGRQIALSEFSDEIINQQTFRVWEEVL